MISEYTEVFIYSTHKEDSLSNSFARKAVRCGYSHGTIRGMNVMVIVTVRLNHSAKNDPVCYEERQPFLTHQNTRKTNQQWPCPRLIPNQKHPRHLFSRNLPEIGETIGE